MIVGTGHHGRLALHHLRADSAFDVVAFSAQRDFIRERNILGRPVVSYEELEEYHDPSKFKALVALSYVRLNRTRTRLYHETKSKGFDLVSYISSRASVFNAEVGENCVVHEGAVVENDVSVGNNVHIAGGAIVSHESRGAENCFIGPRAVIAGDVSFGENCFLGANCTIIDCVNIARDCVIGAGAVVLKDTEPGRIYVGNPAKPLAKTSYEKFGVEDPLCVFGTARITNPIVEL